MGVVRLLLERTLQNSSTIIPKQVLEQYSEHYLHSVLQFLQAREPFSLQAQRGLLNVTAPEKEVAPMHPVPTVKWFLAVFVRDVMSCLDETKSTITSTFGSVLTLDSTKKVSEN